MGIIISNGARQAVRVKPAPAAGCGWEAVPGAESRAPAADGRHPLGPAAALCATASCSRGGAGAAVPRSNRADRGPLAPSLKRIICLQNKIWLMERNQDHVFAFIHLVNIGCCFLVSVFIE